MATTFGKAQRILKPAEFKRVFERRQSVHNTNYGIYILCNSLNHPRLGLVVSKKVSNKAVVRNRIKRQIRESFRLQQETLGSIDFVVVAKAPVAKSTSESGLSALWPKAIKRCKR